MTPTHPLEPSFCQVLVAGRWQHARWDGAAFVDLRGRPLDVEQWRPWVKPSKQEEPPHEPA